MSAPTSPPSPSAPYAAPPRTMRSVPTSWLTVAVTVGTAIAAAGISIAIATSRSRVLALDAVDSLAAPHSHLETGRFILGLLASLALIAVGVVGYLLDRDPARRRLLVSYPGAIGALGLGGMMVDVSDSAGTWLAGPVALAAAGALWLLLDRSTPLLLIATAGLLVFVGRVIVKLVDANHPSEHSHVVVWVVLGSWAIVGALSAAAWFVEESRDTIVVVLGIVGAIVSIAGMVVLEAQRLSAMFSGFGSGSGPREPGFTLDVWVVLLVTLVGVAGWAYCYLRSPRAAYRVIVLVVLMSILPVGVTVLTASDPSPTTWLAVFAVVGILVLVGVLVLGLASPTGGAHGAPPLPPSGPSQPGQQTRFSSQPHYPGHPQAPSAPPSAPPSGPSAPPPSYRPPSPPLNQ